MGAPELLQTAQFGTRVEGRDVVMQLGPKEVRLSYETALKLSAFLRHSGRQAKRNAGNAAPIVTVYANLTDANLDELKAERSRDGTAVYNRG